MYTPQKKLLPAAEEEITQFRRTSSKRTYQEHQTAQQNNTHSAARDLGILQGSPMRTTQSRVTFEFSKEATRRIHVPPYNTPQGRFGEMWHGLPSRFRGAASPPLLSAGSCAVSEAFP